MAAQDDKEKSGRVLLSVWVEKSTLRAIDRRVAHIQEERTEKIHRSDVVREILSEWAAKESEAKG